MFVTNSKLKVVDLKIGDLAPDFTLFSPNKNKDYSLNDFLSKPVVIAFIPNNIGWVCTREICLFRDQLSKFEESGANVICISPNTPKSNLRFANRHNIHHPILCDKNGKVGKLFGANGTLPKKWYINYGRTTFVVDKDGRIAFNYNTHWFRHSSHIHQSLEVVNSLKEQQQ